MRLGARGEGSHICEKTGCRQNGSGKVGERACTAVVEPMRKQCWEPDNGV
jgi:hypothetical protein